MEEHILKILKDNLDGFGYPIPEESTAKEITAHVMEFIQWLRKEVTTSSEGRENRNSHWFYLGSSYTDEGIYEYWLTNVNQ